jgi:hypothetical protein
MTEPMFRTLVQTVPFLPFTILTDDGREFPVEHPENYWIAPNMPLVHVAWEEVREGDEPVVIQHVTAIEIEAVNSIKRERAIA